MRHESDQSCSLDSLPIESVSFIGLPGHPSLVIHRTHLSREQPVTGSMRGQTRQKHKLTIPPCTQIFKDRS